jgi:hypothetical protein
MKPQFLIIFLFLTIGLTRTSAGKPDTLSLTDYLKLFNYKYTTDYTVGWTNEADFKKLNFSFDTNTSLHNRFIRLNNGSLILPEIWGFAYSYRQVNSNLYWLIYYGEGEVDINLFLTVLDTKKRIISKPYRLACAGGDEEDWDFRFGKFINDSTYKYVYAFGTGANTRDSVSGLDRIRPNGEIIEIKKIKLKK